MNTERPLFLPYSWNPWAKPASEDCLNKTIGLTKFGILSGLYVSALDIGLYTKPKTIAAGLTRVGYHTSLLGAATFTYGSSLSIIGKMRNKDDEYNHFLAGLLTGSVFGVKFNSQKIGWGLGFVFGVVALLVKAGYQEGWVIENPENNLRQKHFLNNSRNSFFTERPNPLGKQDV